VVQTRLERSETNKVIAGVCGGVAEYLAIDATLVRVFFVVLGFGGIGILAYIALLIFMPLPGRPAPFTGLGPASYSGTPPSYGSASPSADPADPAAPPATYPVPASADPERRGTTIGIFLVAIGFLFLLGNLGFFRFFEWRYIWPLALILFGVLLLLRRTRR
jgi:phage shock protein C